MRSTQQMRDLWAPHGPSHNTLRFAFWNGVYVRGDGRMYDALKALDAILRRYQYRPKQDETWGYNNRAITGGSRPSLHAYGIAFDINSRANPYGRKLISDMPRAMVEEIEAICTVDGQRVWRWGGDWNDNNKADDDSHDAMHFECQASPAELARGVLVPAGAARAAPAAPTPQSEEDDMLMWDPVDQKAYAVFGDRKVYIEDLAGRTNLIVGNHEDLDKIPLSRTLP